MENFKKYCFVHIVFICIVKYLGKFKFKWADLDNKCESNA